jgi:hypothetical protein
MSSVIQDHPVIASVDDDGTERITVFDADTVICGAFRPAGHLYWRLYLTAAVATADSPVPQIPPPPLLTARPPRRMSVAANHRPPLLGPWCGARMTGRNRKAPPGRVGHAGVIEHRRARGWLVTTRHPAP